VLKLREYDGLVSSIYEAALAPERWSALIAEMARSVGGASALMFSPALAPGEGGFWAGAGHSPDPMASYTAYYYDKDLWRLALAQPGHAHRTVSTGEMLVPDTVFRSCEFYNEFLRPQGIARVMTAQLRHRDQAAPDIHLSIFRPPGAHAFDAEDQRCLGALVPHLRRALRTHYVVAAKAAEAADYLSVIERLNAGVLLIDTRGQVLFANAAAKLILDRRDGLFLCRGRLLATTAHLSERVARAIATAILPPGPTSREPVTIPVQRPSGRRALALTVCPVRGDNSWRVDFRHAAAIVLVGDPDARRPTSEEALTRLYRLTPAETRLATALAAGHTLAQAAELFGIRVETARIQLKSVFAKTGVRRQAELVRLVLLSDPAFAGRG
jgi:DNA-binding CsgD family transcriptional regulator/PAS domain-containing protein